MRCMRSSIENRKSKIVNSHVILDDQSGGFTLLEMMLSLVLFVTGTLAAMTLIHRAQAAATDGENVLIATHLAQRRLEELRNVAFASVVSESQASVTDPSGFTRFDRGVAVTTPVTNLKQLISTVYWDTAGGEANVSLQTYRSAD